MKGISTILATILIVIIVVALVSLTYTFAIGLFGTSSRGATGGVEQTTMRMDKAVAFVTDPTCSGTGVISFTIRHLGATYDINQTEISVLFGQKQETIDTNSWALSKLLNAGKTQFVNTTADSSIVGQTAEITVSAPAASIYKMSVKCS